MQKWYRYLLCFVTLIYLQSTVIFIWKRKYIDFIHCKLSKETNQMLRLWKVSESWENCIWIWLYSYILGLRKTRDCKYDEIVNRKVVGSRPVQRLKFWCSLCELEWFTYVSLVLNPTPRLLKFFKDLVISVERVRRGWDRRWVKAETEEKQKESRGQWEGENWNIKERTRWEAEEKEGRKWRVQAQREWRDS